MQVDWAFPHASCQTSTNSNTARYGKPKTGLHLSDPIDSRKGEKIGRTPPKCQRKARSASGALPPAAKLRDRLLASNATGRRVREGLTRSSTRSGQMLRSDDQYRFRSRIPVFSR